MRRSIASDTTPPHPEPLLEVRVQRLDIAPGLVGVCAGYELGKWRAARLAAHMIEWLPDFVLREVERKGLRSENAVQLIAKAAQAVYTSPNYKHRGEPGELLLHVILRQVFKTTPVIAKLYFKDSANDTVKGFDAVHVVATDTELELWLGEVKFYASIASAIRDVVPELHDHFGVDYLRREFAAIINKIDQNQLHGRRLRKLLDANTSLDEVFDRVRVPVLLAYDSQTMAVYDSVSDEFRAAFMEEVTRHYSTFCEKRLPPNLTIQLLLLPMNCKEDLVNEFDKRLKSAQGML